MPKSYQATGKISQAKLKKLMKGKNVTLTGDGEDDLDLEFNTLKDYNRYVKSMTSGKGFVLNHNKMKDILHNGGSLRSVSQAFKKAGNNIQSGLKKAGIKRMVKDVARNALTGLAMAGTAYLGGDPQMGAMLAGPMADKAVDKIGLGIKSDLKKFGRNKQVKQFARGARQAVKEIGRELKPIAREMARSAIEQAKSDASAKIRQDYVPRLLDRVDNYAGTAYGDIVANTADNMLASQGMGLHPQPRGSRGLKRGKGFKSLVSKAKHTVGVATSHPGKQGGAIEAEESFGLGGSRLGKSPFLQGMDAKERMAYVRSHRKSVGAIAQPTQALLVKGGSMVKLGGSFKGL
jgi:hypothetical protein